jgi:hypothetical protein
MRRLRALSNHDRNREVRWDSVYEGQVPSGWGEVKKPGVLDKTMHFFYEKLQFSGTKKKPGRDDSDRWHTDIPHQARGMEVPRHPEADERGRE